MFQLVRAQFALEQYLDAIRSLEKVIECSPEHLAACNNPGNTCVQSGEFEKAVEGCRKAASSVAHNASIQHNLEQALQQLIMHLQKSAQNNQV